MDVDFSNIPADKNWTIIYTKSRREKKVAQLCDHFGITHYLPLEQRAHLYGRKKVTHQLPLFPGYLFCCCNKNDRYNLLMSHQIAKVLNVIDQVRLMNDLQKIYIAQQTELDLRPCQYFQKGQKVRILSGPLSGYEGVVAQIKTKNRLILNVDFIHSSASVEVENLTIEPINY